MRSPKRAPSWLTVSAVLALIFTIGGLTPPSVAAEGELQGWLIVYPDTDRVEGENFPVGAHVSVWVNGTQIDDGNVGVSSRDGGGWSIFEVASPFDIVEGTIVRATIDTVERTTTVTSLWIDGVVGDTISGVADGPTVTVACNGLFRDVTVGDGGAWSVNWAEPGTGAGETATTTLGPGTTCGAWDIDEAAAFGPSFTRVQLRIPDTHITVNPAGWVAGWDFAPNAPISITLDGARVDGGEVVTDAWGNFWASRDEGLLGDVEFGAGQVVRANDGASTRDLVVSAIAVTSVVGSVVSGTAEPGTPVLVGFDADDNHRTATTSEGGLWSVNFGIAGEGENQPPVELVPGARGYASQAEADGDATQVDWRVASPAIAVNPGGRWIEVLDFAPEAEITVTIAGVPLDEPLITDSSGYVWADVATEIRSGDIVHVTDGMATRDLVVSDLAVTGISGNQISGTGSAASVHLWVNDSDVQRDVPITAGSWMVDVGLAGEDEWEQATTDLGPGSNGAVEDADDDGDRTIVDWGISNPHFTANLDWNGIEGWDWDDAVTVTIEDPDTAASQTFDGSAIQYPEPGFFSLALDDVEPRWRLEPGQLVTVADATATKQLTVAALAVDGWDLDTDTMWGTSDQPGRVSIDVDRADAHGWSEVDSPAGPWTVDFSTGDEPFDLRVMDVAILNLVDADGDSTMIGPWTVAGPRFVAGLVNQEIVGCDWPDGTLVTVTVERAGMLPSVRTVMSGAEIPETWMPLSGACNVYFDLASGPLVMAGDVITMSDGTTTRTQVVPDLEVNLADEIADELSGSTTMPAGSFLTVAANWWWLNAPLHDAAVGADGTWTTSFAGEWDIQGSSGYAVQTDVDGDQTVVTAPAPDVLNDPMADRIWAIDFAPGPVELTIERDGGVAFSQVTQTRNVISGSWRYRDMWAQPVGTLERPAVALWDLAGTFDIQAGDVITVRDGVSERMIVVDELTIDSIDATTGTVVGHAAGDVAFNLNEGQGFWGYGASPVDGVYEFVFDPNEFPYQELEPGMTVIAIGESWQTIVRATVPAGYDFTGFLAPIDNRPTLNAVKAGRAIPVKFSLGGDFGLDIFATGYPASRPITNTGAPTDAVEITLAAGTSSLTYDPATGLYTYIWKTDKAWAGTCRQLVLRLNDGTEYLADFKF